MLKRPPAIDFPEHRTNWVSEVSSQSRSAWTGQTARSALERMTTGTPLPSPAVRRAPRLAMAPNENSTAVVVKRICSTSRPTSAARLSPLAASSNSARSRVPARSAGSGRPYGSAWPTAWVPAVGASLRGVPRARSPSPQDLLRARRNRSGDVFARLPSHGDSARRRSASSRLGSKRPQPWWRRPPAGPVLARGTNPRMPSNPPRRAAVSRHWGFGCAALRPLQ